MRNFLLGLCFMALTIISSCTTDETSIPKQNEKQNTNLSRIVGDDDADDDVGSINVVIGNDIVQLAIGRNVELGDEARLNERGFAGPGVNFPGRIGFNDCNKPHGECVFMDVFGGRQGNHHLWTAEMLDEHRMRLVFNQNNPIDILQLTDQLNDDLQSGNAWVQDENGNPTGESFDSNQVANYIATHYSIPNAIPFNDETNHLLLDNPNYKLYTVGGDYEIIFDATHPNGYFDMEVTIH